MPSTSEDLQWIGFLEDVPKTLARARVRCMTNEQLLSRLSCLHEDELATEVINELEQRSLTPVHCETLAASIAKLALDVPDGSARATLDRRLGRLTACVPDDQARRRLAATFIQHRRKSRRMAGYRAVRRSTLDAELAALLWAAYTRFRDNEACEMICRSNDAVLFVPPLDLLSTDVDPYWHGRVVESLLINRPDEALSLRHQYKREFLHALGRRGDARYLAEAEEVALGSWPDPELLGLYVWLLGKLRDSPRLERLAGRLSAERQRAGIDDDARPTGRSRVAPA